MESLYPAGENAHGWKQWKVSQKTQTTYMIWSSNSTSENRLEEVIPNFKSDMHSYVHCSVTYNSKNTKQPKPKCPSIDEWRKMWNIYAVENYSAIKKNEILPFATTWRELEGINLT